MIKRSWRCLRFFDGLKPPQDYNYPQLDVNINILPSELVTWVSGFDLFIFLPFIHNNHAPLFMT